MKYEMPVGSCSACGSTMWFQGFDQEIKEEVWKCNCGIRHKKEV